MNIKGDRDLDTAEIAKRIRAEIAEAVHAKQLPQANYSVRTSRYSMGSSITVVASKLPFQVRNPDAFYVEPGATWVTFDHEHYRSRMTPEAQDVERKLEAIVDQYHWDRSHPASDYFHASVHKSVEVQDDLKALPLLCLSCLTAIFRCGVGGTSVSLRWGEDEARVKYGFTDQAWAAAKQEATDILSKRAKLRGMIPYSDLVRQVTAIQLEPDSFALSAFLGEISESEEAAGHGMLTVIVVHKYGDMQPGPGFFDLAKRLGRDTSDIVKCWVEELKRVHAYWST